MVFRKSMMIDVTEDGVYRLWNETDHILAAPDVFKTKELAQACAEKLRKRFAAQGFYLTTDGSRIAPEDVKLVVAPAGAVEGH